jgi:hypothetical protein
MSSALCVSPGALEVPDMTTNKEKRRCFPKDTLERAPMRASASRQG